MRSTTTVMNSLTNDAYERASNGVRTGLASLLLLALAGCASVPNQYVEDGPAVSMAWNSPTAAHVIEETEQQELHTRDFAAMQAQVEPYATTHWPLYFEDPFADKGSGREGLNKYRMGWEDWVALPYGYSRFTLNWMFLPVSAVVTPPWTLMESDGKLSPQLLGYDHDATKSTRSAFDAE